MQQKKYNYDEALTNEHLLGQFPSQFDLVNRAIKIGDYLVTSGKAFTNSWPDNIPAAVLKKMAEEGVERLEKEVYI
jgi:cell shape-determining protein MreC